MFELFSQGHITHFMQASETRKQMSSRMKVLEFQKKEPLLSTPVVLCHRNMHAITRMFSLLFAIFSQFRSVCVFLVLV